MKAKKLILFGSCKKNSKKCSRLLQKQEFYAPIGPPKNGKFYGGLSMTKHFRFTVELKANINDSPKDVEGQEPLNRVRRLAKKFAADGELLTEVYKVVFFDLLFGDYYSEEVLRRVKQKAEMDLILPVANQMAPQDSAFFTEFFSASGQEDPEVDRDDVLNLFYSHFRKPQIAHIDFECFDKNDKGKENKK
jgi:hypothetical protein